MSDFASSQPVRTEAAGDIVSKICDATITTRQLTVNANGSLNVTDNGTSLTVDAVDLDIRNLVFATDKVDVSGSVIALDAPTLAALESITVQNPAGASAVNIQDGGNSITVDGTVTVSNLPTTVDTNYGTVGASTIRTAAEVGNATGAANFNFGTVGAQTLRTASQIGNATGAADFNAGTTGAQTLRVEANQGTSGLAANGWFTRVTDGTDTLQINTDGSLNVNVSGNPVGAEVNNYNTAAAIAGGGTSNHDYTVTGGTTLYLKQIETTASGRIKIEVQVESGVGTGTFSTRFVQFNSTSFPNTSIQLQSPITVAAGVRVRVIRTNRDLLALDVYSTVSGQEV